MGNHVKKLRKDDISKVYEIKEKLGAGNFATVKRAIRKEDGKEFAIKVIKKSKMSSEDRANVHEEIEIMHKISHPHCVQLLEMFEDKKKIFMVMELLTGGELFDRIVDKGSYSEKEASDLIRSIAHAIQYLHSIGIVHRDLKPENLLYRSEDEKAPIKITDFGLAKFRAGVCGSDPMTTACGTPGYVAPEVLCGMPYGKEVDLWSLGVILYILLCGFPPFFHQSPAVLYHQIKKGMYDFPDPYWTNISKSAKDLVEKLLTVSPAQRFTAKQVLEHPWIAGNDASTASLPGQVTQFLRILKARRQLRKACQTIIAINKFARALLVHVQTA